MKPRKSKLHRLTPHFPALWFELYKSVSVKGEAPRPTKFPRSVLPGFACDVNERPSPASAKRQKDYDAYLASPRWKEKRAPIIARANGRCEDCGQPCMALEVHHLTYERVGGLELPDDLKALCPACHKKADAARKVAWKKQLAKWEDEAEEARKAGRFDKWMRRRHGAHYHDDLGIECVAEEWEKWEELQRDRFEDDYE